MSSADHVGRVAYITSSRLIEVQSSLLPRQDSSVAFNFSPYGSLEAQPELVSVPKDADIAQILSTPTSLTTLAVSFPDPSLISRLLVFLPSLSLTPLVVNIAIDRQTLSRALTLRSSLPFVLFSGTTVQAHDHALLAARLAHTEKKAVLHIFLSETGPNSQHALVDIQEALITRFIAAPPRTGAVTNRDGHHANGNGKANGNGHAINGHAKTNGHGHVRTDSLARDLDDSPDSDLYRAYSGAALSTLALVRRAMRSSTYTGPAHPQVVAIALSKSHQTLILTQLL